MSVRVNGFRIQKEGHRPWLNAATPEDTEPRSAYLLHKDRPEVVAACLNCQAETCKTGHCAKLQRHQRDGQNPDAEGIQEYF